MSNHKTKKRLIAMMISVIMVVGMMPVSVSAEASTLPIGSSGEIIAFGDLGVDIMVQDVPFGTPQTDLNLPDTLTATIRLATPKEGFIRDSGEADLEPDSDEIISGSAIVIDEMKVTVPIPVTWTSSTGYDGEIARTHLFTPKLQEGIALASDVEVPTISVTVGVAAIIGRVAAFDELPDDIRWQNTTTPVFPEEVSGTVDEEAVRIPVSWQTEQDYDEKAPAKGLYVFCVVPREGYTLAGGIEAPRITVYIPEAASRFAPLRMGGGGTGASPLEITTVAQLAEIAALVNAGRLESFLFNDNTATVYLKLQNDLDLSAYSENYNEGKGWVPIGHDDHNTFKGNFDGNANKITGLYINHTGYEHTGLFGWVSGGTIQNIGLVDVDITGNEYVGGVAGYVHNGTVQSCYSTGSISGNIRVGGVAGYVRSGTVQSCYATGRVSGNDQVGRVVGLNSGRLINNYAFSGMKVNGNTVTGDGDNNSNGTDLSITRANDASFWTTVGNWNTSAWDTSIWTIADGKLPILTVYPTGTQFGDGGVYLTERDIANASVSSIDNLIYNGSQQIPTLTFDGTALIKDTDYTIRITSMDDIDTSAGIKVGEVTITITGEGNFKGTKTSLTYTIHPKTLMEDMLAVTGGAFTYIGIPHTPDVMVTDGTTLTLGTDYDVTYSDNTSAGVASVSVTGKGNYAGIASKSFTIQKASAPTITWPTATDIAYGLLLLESALVGGSTEYGDFAWETSETIPTVTNSGYEVIFTSSEATVNNYEPISPTREIVQIAVTAKSISRCTVDAIDPVTYKGEAQTPVVAVKDGVTTLTSGADYEVTYFDNTSAGTAAVAIEGKGNYIGTRSKNFTIEKRPVTVKANDKKMTRGGTLPTFTYTVDGQLSEETALAGVPAFTCVADGKTAGSYPITIDLAGVSYTANYQAANPALVNGTLTVNYPSSSGSGKGSSFGSHTAITVLKKQPDQPVTAEISVIAMAGQNGRASANLSDKSITGAIAKAQASAKAQGEIANGIGIALNTNLPQGASSVSLSLSKNALKSLVNSGVTSFKINGVIASLSLDLEALKEIKKQGAKNLDITIKPVQNLSSGARTMIGTRPVYDVTVSYSKNGKTVNITSLGKGVATLSIPYAPGRNEAVGYLLGVYVDGKGKATRIPDSCYDANSGSIILGSNHLGVYGVSYISSCAKFTDINSHWGKEAIDYVVGRGLFSGTTDTTFSPNMAMDRGMLVTVLGRLSGTDVSADKISSFIDVAVGKYYLPYIEWAYKRGIVSGIGSGKFAPDQAITREEIAMIFANYAKATGYNLPVTQTAVAFRDVPSVGSAYKTAVTAMQQAGIMMGGTNNTFNPKASATRAEVSAMLYRYIKLTIKVDGYGLMKTE